MSDTMIKICGLFREQDTDYINCALPDYTGFVFYEKSRRYITPESAKKLRAKINPAIKVAGVFVNAPKERIIGFCREGIIDAVQLHGGESEQYISELRTGLAGVPIWKAFTVHKADDLEAAQNSTADIVLLDNGCGTGERFDWSLVGTLERPFILAGGLTPDNIPDAISTFHPYMVDLSSGVESDGVKDTQKIAAAVAAVRRS